MDKLYRNRRFGLAVALTLASIAGLFLDQLEGGEFIALSGVILGMYGGGLDRKEYES
jgi:hypothetical protein